MSVLHPRRWVVRSRIDAGVLGMPDQPVFAQLLANRGLLQEGVTPDAQSAERFLSPDYDRDLGDPMLLPNMGRGVERVAKALETGEKIALFCDYDCDGVTSATVLTHFFRVFAGLEDLTVYLPDRISEGYGLNNNAIDYLASIGTKLIVTADLGTSNSKQIAYAATKGVDVVVIDHHLAPPGLDPELIIINPKIAGHTYPFDGFCAAGTCFQFVRAFIAQRPDLLPGFAPGQEKWLLDVVAIGTVADCMPLLSENRVLVTYGLRVLAQTRRPGLQALMERAAVDVTRLGAGSIGFAIGPRINAAGRLEHANTAYSLMVSEDPAEIAELADILEQTNGERQRLTESLAAAATEQIGDPGDKRIVIAAGEGWSQGVVGIVAGRIVERFARPAFVFSIREDDQVTGSARSMKGFDIVEAIRSQKHLLTTFGGHTMAAGCSMAKENLEAFKEGIEAYARERLQPEDLTRTLEIDMELPLAHVDWSVAELIAKFQPTGIANPGPLFVSRGLEIAEVRTVGTTGAHLKLRLRAAACDGKEHCVETLRDAELDPDAPVRCRATSCLMESSGFGLGVHAETLRAGDRVDAVYEVDINEWNGKKTLQLRIVDLKKVETNGSAA